MSVRTRWTVLAGLLTAQASVLAGSAIYAMDRHDQAGEPRRARVVDVRCIDGHKVVSLDVGLSGGQLLAQPLEESC